jgi:hypothetical protein
MMAVHEPKQRTGLRHLVRMTDDRGIIEHARGAHPRFHTGYCVDDNARLLIVAVRDKNESQESATLARIGARFLLDAQRRDGHTHNRMSFERIWQDTATTDDCWGRALWGFGEAVLHSQDMEVKNRCYDGFDVGSLARSNTLRSMCFAALGAASVLEVDERNRGAFALLEDIRAMLAFHPNGHGSWQWVEPRLTYANAVIPEAMIACGYALGDNALVTRGLDLLRWLVEKETMNDHLSVTPVGGRGPLDHAPQFDQQPIEVAALADAAMRAGSVSGTEEWDEVVHMAGNWFLGNNDTGLSMIDLKHGGGYDGLHEHGVNVNQGAESTLAMLSTMQHRSAMWLV